MPHPDNTINNGTSQQFASSPASDEWKLTDVAFNKLLSCLSSNPEEAAQLYELLRRKLIRFCESNLTVYAEEGVDEIINRVTRKIDQGANVPNVFAYALGVARLLMKEFWKERNRAHSVSQELLSMKSSTEQIVEDNDEDVRLRCFDSCLERLSSEHRNLIIEYYREDKAAKIELRRDLAQQLNIPLNALRIRAHRVRKSLEECVKECLGAGKGNELLQRN